MQIEVTTADRRMIQSQTAASRASDQHEGGVDSVDRGVSVFGSGHRQAKTGGQYRGLLLLGSDNLRHGWFLQFLGFDLLLRALARCRADRHVLSFGETPSEPPEAQPCREPIATKYHHRPIPAQVSAGEGESCPERIASFDRSTSNRSDPEPATMSFAASRVPTRQQPSQCRARWLPTGPTAQIIPSSIGDDPCALCASCHGLGAQQLQP